MKNKVFTIVLCIILSFLIITYLVVRSSRQLRHKNHFVRHFPSHALTDFKKLDLEVNSYYFAGANRDQIYFGNITSPLILKTIDQHLNDTSDETFRLSDNPILIKENLRMLQNDSSLVLLDMSTGKTYSGKISSNPLHPGLDIDLKNMESVQQYGPGKFIIKYYDPGVQNSFIAKVAAGIPLTKFPLDRLVDGHFCEDGELIRDFGGGSFAYLYFYRNQVVVFDSSMTNQQLIKTIDTISHPQLSLKEYPRADGTTARTMAAPPVSVNNTAAIAGNDLYIHSSRIADNEDENKFKHTSVIDVYDIRTGQYKYSFYIPDVAEKKVRGMIVLDRQLFALMGQFLISFTLNDIK